MDAKRLIELVNSDLFRFEDMTCGAKARDLSPQDLCDSISFELAELYLEKRISWEEGDLAMNTLFSWAYQPKDMFEFSKFSWAVYYAFDEAEYLHPNDPPGADPTLRTAPMLQAALAKLLAQPGIPADASRRG